MAGAGPFANIDIVAGAYKAFLALCAHGEHGGEQEENEQESFHGIAVVCVSVLCSVSAFVGRSEADVVGECCLSCGHAQVESGYVDLFEYPLHHDVYPSCCCLVGGMQSVALSCQLHGGAVEVAFVSHHAPDGCCHATVFVARPCDGSEPHVGDVADGVHHLPDTFLAHTVVVEAYLVGAQADDDEHGLTLVDVILQVFRPCPLLACGAVPDDGAQVVAIFHGIVVEAARQSLQRAVADEQDSGLVGVAGSRAEGHGGATDYKEKEYST